MTFPRLGHSLCTTRARASQKPCQCVGSWAAGDARWGRGSCVFTHFSLCHHFMCPHFSSPVVGIRGEKGTRHNTCPQRALTVVPVLQQCAGGVDGVAGPRRRGRPVQQGCWRSPPDAPRRVQGPSRVRKQGSRRCVYLLVSLLGQPNAFAH